MISLELWNPTRTHLGCLCPATREKSLRAYRLARSTCHTCHSSGPGVPLNLISLLKHKTQKNPHCVSQASLLWKTREASKPWDIKLHHVPGLLMFPGQAGILFVVLDKEQGSWFCCLRNKWDTVPQIRLFSLLSQHINPFSLLPTLGFSVCKSSVMLDWP